MRRSFRSFHVAPLAFHLFNVGTQRTRVRCSWKRLTAFACVVGFCLIPTAAKADLISLGVLSYDTFIPGGLGSPGVDAFNIANFTGPFNLPPDFPVTDNLTLQGATLTLFQNGQTPQVLMLGDIGPGFLLDSFGNPVVQVPDNELFTSAEFTATLSVTQFALASGGSFVANSAAIDALLLPSSGPSLTADVDQTLIEAAGAFPTVTTPEPAGVVLLLSILVLCIWRLRASPFAKSSD